MNKVEIQKSDVEALFRKGGYTINERFPEAGFLYFPEDGSKSAESPDQGRVFWHVEKAKLDEEQRRINDALGICEDELKINASWGRPTDQQIAEITELLRNYVLYCRQQRG